MVAEFREFLLKTNALALAIGVIIGTALGTVVNSLVNDIIMPPIGLVLGGVDFAKLEIVLKDAVGDGSRGRDPLRRVHQFDHRLHRDRVRRLAALEDVHQGRGRGTVEDVPVLQGSQRGRRDEVPRLRQHDLTNRRIASGPVRGGFATS